MVREELSAEKTAEQILNAVKAEPWRYLRREHSSRGKEVGGTLACWWGGGEVGDAGQRPGQAEWDVRSQKSSCAGTSRQGQVMWALVQAVVRI